MSEIKFGILDTKTGNFQEGSVKDGKMVYEPLPWWKRIIYRKPRKKEILQIVNIIERRTPVFAGPSYDVKHEAIVYREFNPYTNETYAIYAKVDGNTLYYDNGLYDYCGVLKMLK